MSVREGEVEALCNRLDVNQVKCDLLVDWIEKKLAVYEEKVVKPKKKRKPSEYNLFIGKCIKARSEGTPVQEAMKSCAIKWKKEKKKKKKK